MSRTDRIVRRARRHLSPAEALLASAVGTEADGRRRQVVLLTDRRLVVAGTRAKPPTVFELEGSTAAYDRIGELLTLANGEQQVVLRDIDEPMARHLAQLLAHRRPRIDAVYEPYVHRVRIVS